MNQVTEKFIQLSAPHYVKMLDTIEKYFDARFDVTKNKQEIDKFKQKTFEYNADLQAIFNGLLEACSENNIVLFDVLDHREIENNFIDSFFYFSDDISEHIGPNVELTNQARIVFLDLLNLEKRKREHDKTPFLQFVHLYLK